MNDLELNNDNAPSYRKENPSLFRPPSASQTLRQAIYAQLKANPEKNITVVELRGLLGSSSQDTNRACRQLVRHGFATSALLRVERPTKKDPDSFIWRKSVRYVQPWEGKKQSKW